MLADAFQLYRNIDLGVEEMKRLINYFSKIEITLWICSVMLITISFCIFDRENFLTLFASLVGVTAIIVCAKGNPIGQVLMIIFSLIYAFISYTFAYYGELITYAFMTLPIAVFSLISWLRNPYNGNKAEVKVNTISKKETVFMWILAIVVTVMFYFILTAFNTANIVPSTISITTSFLAVYLSFRRSPYFSVAYAANDVVLIILWTLASFSDFTYISVVVCFIAFLFNDIYCFANWKSMEKRQSLG